MPVWVRRCLLFACFMASWLVVRPAAAAAPYCDERAASGIAPPPTLDVSDASVDVGDKVSDACEAWLRADLTYERGHRSDPPSTTGNLEPAMLSELAALPEYAPVAFVEIDSRAQGPAGVRSLLERPPR